MSTELRELFDTAAESTPPYDLGERAIAGARRRRQRYAVVGSALAAAAVVLGVVAVSAQVQTDASPRPADVATLPDALPAADGLPNLQPGTMDAASAAYIVDGEVVVIDAATGDGALVDFAPSQELYGGVPLTIEQDASVSLSPSGRYLMVSSGFRASDFPSEWNPKTEWMWLLDVGSGDARLLQDLELATSPRGSEISPTRMAWSPDGGTFACICAFPTTDRPQLVTIEASGLTDDGGVKTEGTGVAPTQISWGTDGLVARLPELGGDWRLVPPGDGSMADPKEWPTISSVLDPGAIDDLVTAMVMGQSRQGGFLGVMKGGREFWIVNDVRDWTVPSVSVRPVLGALGNSYFTVYTDWKGDPVNYEVVRIDSNGETPFTTLPPGSSTVAFASDLID